MTVTAPNRVDERESRPPSPPQPAESSAAPTRQPSGAPTAFLTLAALAVMMWPLSSVIGSQDWVVPVLIIALAGVTAAFIARGVTRRWSRAARIAVTVVAQIGAMTAVIMGQNFADQAVAAIVPTPAIVQQLPGIVDAAIQELVQGSAPLAMTAPLHVTLALSVLVLVVALDFLLAVTATPVVVGVLVAVVSSVPSLVLRQSIDVALFTGWAVLMLVLLRVRTGEPANRPAPLPRPRMTAAVLVGALTIMTALAVAPAVPTKPSGVGSGDGLRINPSLDLGADLRERDSSIAMTLITTADRAPYLRVASLSHFDGQVWNPDVSPARPLGASPNFGEGTTGVARVAATTSIRVTGLTGSWLPVPYAAGTVRGLDGTWRSHPGNGTISSDNSDIAGQNYTVESITVEPTAEQARAARASPAYVSAEFSAVPDGLPPVIAATAADIVAGESNDFDRLVALQNWFRSDFRYSLEAPVAKNFDGTGVDAVAAFLEEQAGYCVHFAGSFALMARTLGMPSRIIVGYLPGTPTSQKQEGQTVYTVATDQLHAWPEVHFDDLGWVAFEPTATRGTPTRFAAEQHTDTSTAAATDPQPATTQNSIDVDETPVDAPDANRPTDTNTATSTPVPWPVLAGLAAFLVLATAPAVIRMSIRQLRMLRSRRGDAGAAWAEIRDTLLDYSLDAPESETPRERGERLRTASGTSADDPAIQVLVTAIEQASYAPARETESDLSVPVRSVIRQLHQKMPAGTRLRATVLPRSLATLVRHRTARKDYARS